MADVMRRHSAACCNRALLELGRVTPSLRHVALDISTYVNSGVFCGSRSRCCAELAVTKVGLALVACDRRTRGLADVAFNQALELTSIALPCGRPLLLQLQLSTKLFWTVAALIVYLVCSQVPLYGINATGNNDAFYIMRMILVGSRGGRGGDGGGANRVKLG